MIQHKSTKHYILKNNDVNLIQETDLHVLLREKIIFTKHMHSFDWQTLWIIRQNLLASSCNNINLLMCKLICYNREQFRNPKAGWRGTT